MPAGPRGFVCVHKQNPQALPLRPEAWPKPRSQMPSLSGAVLAMHGVLGIAPGHAVPQIQIQIWIQIQIQIWIRIQIQGTCKGTWWPGPKWRRAAEGTGGRQLCASVQAPLSLFVSVELRRLYLQEILETGNN